jgi:nitric oxide reductase NorE protein
VSTPNQVGAGAVEFATPRRLPGVDGLWVAIGADAVIFAILFSSFMQARLRQPVVFEHSRQALDITFGGIDTLILLTSSWSIALAVQALKRGLIDRVPRYVLGGVLTGLMFMASKGFEYFLKFAHGIRPATNDFYMWYFTLTGMHLVHVVFGTCLLTYVWVGARNGAYSSLNRVVPECVASYWHLVDLLWIMLFPLLYLMKAQ